MRQERSPLRWLFHLAAAMSLLLCAAVMVVWVRSQSMSDEILLIGDRTTLQIITEGDRMFLRQWLPHGRSGERTFKVFHDVDRQWNMRRPDSPPGTPLLVRLGFDGYGFDEPALFDGAPARAVWIPYWSLLLLTLFPPTLWAWMAVRRVRRNRRAPRGLCPICGYDLRASPNRCPECGTIPQPPHNPPMQRTATASSGAVE
jgi:hypothetical protein